MNRRQFLIGLGLTGLWAAMKLAQAKANMKPSADVEPEPAGGGWSVPWQIPWRIGETKQYTAHMPIVRRNEK